MPAQFSKVLIGIGSNLGDRAASIAAAKEAIGQQCGRITASASIFETPPIGAADQLFLNTAVICSTMLDPEPFLDQLLAIEQSLGRRRDVHWGNRTIDLDILLWQTPDGEALVRDSARICIPHPEMLHRPFVMIPSVEIAGAWIHPLADRSLQICLSRSEFIVVSPSDQGHLADRHQGN